MFGQPKPLFGTATTGTTFGTGTFGQSTGFAQPTTGGIFGAKPAATTGGLFGSTAGATPLFGATSTTATGTTGFTGFGTPGQQNAATAGLFGTTQNKALFGTTTGTAFGQTQGAGGTLFGQQQPQQQAVAATGTGLFGQPAASTSAGLFGVAANPAVAVAAAGTQGSAIAKFNPPTGHDTMMRNNQQQSIQTKHQCITAMKEYEAFSPEELRVADYLAGRKGPQIGALGGGGFTFGTTTQPSTATGLFGTGAATATTTSSLFGGSLFGATGAAPTGATTGFFGQPAAKPLFGTAAPTTAAGSTGFAFAATNTGTPGTFGQPTTSLFGQPAQQTAGLFGAQPQQPAFGTQPAQAGFGAFSTGTSTGLFAARPAFGTTTTASGGNLFSFTSQPAAPAAGLFGATAAGSTLFKPTATATSTTPFGGFGTQTSAAPAFGTTFGTQPFAASSAAPSVFGAQQQQRPLFGGGTTGTFGAAAGQQQPLFGSTAPGVPGTGLFGATGAAAAPTFGSSLFNTAQKPVGLFTNTGNMAGGFNFAGNTGLQAGIGTQQQPALGTDPATAAAQQLLVQQQLLSLTNSPYGESSVFKTVLPQVSREAQLKPLDPELHRQVIAAVGPGGITASSRHISDVGKPLPRPSPRILTSLNRSSLNRSSLIDDLVDDDSFSKDGFIPRRNIKKLNIKPNIKPDTSNTSINNDYDSSRRTSIRLNITSDDSILNPNRLARQPITSQTFTRKSVVFNEEEERGGSSSSSRLMRPNLDLSGATSSDSYDDANSSTSFTGPQRIPTAMSKISPEPRRPIHGNGGGDTSVNSPSSLHRSSSFAGQPQQHRIYASGDGYRNGGPITLSRETSVEKRVITGVEIGSAGTIMNGQRSLDRRSIDDGDTRMSDGSRGRGGDSPATLHPPPLMTLAPADKDDEDADLPEIPSQPHPTGISLNRPEYYTIPSLDELRIQLDRSGGCIVNDGFTVGREGYGSVYWPGEMSVGGLNLDKIVYFRHKEVTVYPDEDKKPAVGDELNRPAEITLERVWPNDKSTRTPIKSPDRLALLKYREKLEKASARMGATFKDYRPETGAWVFVVPHFTKYGLEEVDDDIPSLDELTKYRDQEILQHAVQRLSPLKDKEGNLLITEKTGSVPPVVPLITESRQGRAAMGHLRDINAGVMPHPPMETSSTVPKYAQPRPHQFGLGGMDIDEGRLQRLPIEPEEIQIPIVDSRPSSAIGLDVDDEMDELPTFQPVMQPSIALMKRSFFDKEADEGAKRLHTASSAYDRSATIQSSAGSRFGHAGDRFADTSAKELIRDASATTYDVYSRSAQLLEQRRERLPFGQDLLPTVHSRTETPVMGYKKPPLPASSAPALLPALLAPAQSSRPRLMTIQHRLIQLPYANSLLSHRSKFWLDSSCFHNRRFRVGWAPGRLLWKPSPAAISGIKDVMDVDGGFGDHMGAGARSGGGGTFDLAVEKATFGPSYSKSYMDSMFECHLDHCDVIANDGVCPQIVPRAGPAIIEALANVVVTSSDAASSDTACERFAGVWNLCKALWYPLPEDLQKIVNQSGGNMEYANEMARKRMLSRWLKETCKKNVAKLLQIKAHSSRAEAIQRLWILLTCGDVPTAAQTAVDAGCPRLANMISQIGSMECRALCTKQLIQWSETKADEHIESDLMKIYILLAGLLEWRPSDGFVVNICDGLDWKRIFGLHLWYSCHPTATLQDVIESYETSYGDLGDEVTFGKTSSDAKMSPSRSLGPLPSFMEDAMIGLGDGDAGDDDDKELRREKLRCRRTRPRDQPLMEDMIYQLVRIFSDRSVGLRSLMNPESYTPDHLDYHMCWHLYAILLAVGHPRLANDTMLHRSYAEQLSLLGFHKWAILVLLSITEPASREALVKSALSQCVTEMCSDDERAICERFMIPWEWMFEAKALLAKYCGNRHNETWFTMKAKCWNKAHCLFLESVGPDLVISKKVESLKEYVEELSKNSSEIHGWSFGGYIYEQYLMIYEQIQAVKELDVDENEVRDRLCSLRPTVLSLASGIDGLSCPTPKHCLCQAEMSQHVATVLRLITPPDQIPSIIPLLEALPLPDDYKMEIRNEIENLKA